MTIQDIEAIIEEETHQEGNDILPLLFEEAEENVRVALNRANQNPTEGNWKAYLRAESLLGNLHESLGDEGLVFEAFNGLRKILDAERQ